MIRDQARYIAIPTVGYPGKILPLLGVIGVLILWSIVSALGLVRPAFLPTPWETAVALWKIFADGSFVNDGWASIRRVAAAISLSALVGIPIGIAINAFDRVKALLK